jgi:ABC-type multidrug transport system fused ATPase/permease subunit
MYKQLSWFDSESRAPGVLTGVLSEDISLLNGMTTETIVVMVEAVMGLAFGVLIGIYFCWIQTLVVLLFSPILITGAIALSRLSWGNKGGGKSEGSFKAADAYEKANALLSDIVMNYKTVTSFGE